MIQSLDETRLRKLIRKAIKIKNIKEKEILVQQRLEEQQLRKVIRHLIVEGDVDADTKPAPYSTTPINMLADALNQILPVIKGGLRKLSEPQERESYRAHMLAKIKSIFGGFESLDVKIPGAIGEGDLTEAETEKEKIKVELDDPDRVLPSDGKENSRFEKAELSPEDKLEGDFEEFSQEGLDPTGARIAFETINDSNIESVLADKRKALASNPEYVQQFKEYSMYNVDLWLASFEEDLARTLGQEPAFTGVTTEKPGGAQIAGSAEKFVSGIPGEMSFKRNDGVVGEETIDYQSQQEKEVFDYEGDTSEFDLPGGPPTTRFSEIV